MNLAHLGYGFYVNLDKIISISPIENNLKCVVVLSTDGGEVCTITLPFSSKTAYEELSK